MNEKKEHRFVMVGVVVGGFIVVFYDLFKYWFGILVPDPNATPFVMAMAGVISVVIGLLLVKFYIKIPNPKT